MTEVITEKKDLKYLMHEAIISGSVEGVKDVMKMGGKIVKQPFSRYASPLVTACENGHIDLVKFILEDQNKINITEEYNDEGYLPVHIVCKKGYVDILKYLIKYNDKIIDIHTKRDINETPLAISINNNRSECVEILIKNKANINSSLNKASEIGNEIIVKCLLENGCKYDEEDEYGDVALVKASRNGNVSCVKMIIDYDMNEDNRVMAMFESIENGHVEVLNEILSNQINPDVIGKRKNKGNTALCLACEKGYLECVNALLYHGAQVNGCNNIGISPLYMASKHGYSKIIKKLIELGANWQFKTELLKMTSLHVASQYGHLSCVKILVEIENSIDSNIFNKERNWENMLKETPIRLACNNGHKEVVEYLIEMGVDVNEIMIQDVLCNGETLLHTAAKKGHAQVVECLLNNGAICDYNKNYNGETALYMACKNEYKDVIEILLKYGAKYDMMMKNGKTPLMVVCDKGNVELIKLFFKMGINKNEIKSLINVKPLEIQNNILKYLNDNDFDHDHINNDDIFEDDKIQTETCFIKDDIKIKEDDLPKYTHFNKNLTKRSVHRDKKDYKNEVWK